VSIKYTIIFQCKTIQNFTQIWIFDLKTNHLATLFQTEELARGCRKMSNRPCSNKAVEYEQESLCC
jgi:hypothetical protein